MTPLWNAEDAAEATGGQATQPFVVTGISIDTRTLEPGDLFVALKDVRDGHNFVAGALEKGAAAALVDHRPDGVAPDAPLLIVPDVQAALESLGQAARARTEARIVAVTGSVGKTSTKEMLRDILSRQGRTHAAVASYNNHWGVPLTLARMPAETEFAVIEIGMNHPGEIAPLARLTRPHVVAVTTVAPAHLEAFDGIEGIAHEKASIVEGVEPNGVAILNAALETSAILFDVAQKNGVRATGFGPDADWNLRGVQITERATIIEAEHAGTPFLFRLSQPGRHFAMNALAALAAVDALGADTMMASHDLAHWSPPEGRGVREQIWLDPARSDWSLLLLDDAFNANPSSMSAAMEVLAASVPADGVGRVHKGRRVAFFGDMLELGPDGPSMHVALAQDKAIDEIDVIHCAGQLMRGCWEALPDSKRGQWSETAQSLAEQAPRLVDAGDVVLVKGSKGSKVSLVVDVIRKMGQSRGAAHEGK